MTDTQHLAVPGPPAARIAFAEAGPTAGSPLVFIHGVGGWHGQWAAQLPYFAARYHCLAPSMRGHGPSETTPGPFGMDRLTDDVRQVVAQRGIAGPLTLIAHSYGGLVALDLARHHPELVERVVLMGLAEELNFGVFFRLIATMPLPNGPLDIARRIWFGKRFFATVAVLRGVMRQAILPWDGWQHLAEISQPVLVIGGQFDAVAPPAAVRALAKRFPNAESAIISGVRHKVQLQNPEAVNQRIEAFLQGESPQRTPSTRIRERGQK